LHGNSIFDGVCLGTKKMPFMWELTHCPADSLAGQAIAAGKFFQRFSGFWPFFYSKYTTFAARLIFNQKNRDHEQL
jgi:hypothetical protein